MNEWEMKIQLDYGIFCIFNFTYTVVLSRILLYGFIVAPVFKCLSDVCQCVTDVVQCFG